uniref:Uncharacterized protein n=1 Tax=Arundo donax TaxID=35708 RepID=A0A0A8ZP14_ARUDO
MHAWFVASFLQGNVLLEAIGRALVLVVACCLAAAEMVFSMTNSLNWVVLNYGSLTP